MGHLSNRDLLCLILGHCIGLILFVLARYLHLGLLAYHLH